ncbi:hypothetical protein ANN_26324 [Periplaneta americana]|uniref:Uncharacterized protein n=1 Tax=Periplaneta americana TaxID=6978 RepID=A0ABQ8S647_PERAM|nr:hypothetical protein ANN_26324 [Periplaneta americana]
METNEHKRKKRRREDIKINLKREDRKMKKQRGITYVTSKGAIVEGRPLRNILQWTNKVTAGCYSGRLVIKKKISTTHKVTENPKVSCENIWTYSLLRSGVQQVVCRQMILELFIISTKRLRVIQRKILKGETFEEKRGSHENRPNKLNNNIWDLLQSHLQSISHTKSHYCQHKSNFEYFDNSDLNIKILFELLCDYYKEKIGDKLNMKYKTYFKYFKQNCNFHFRKPKTDVCDFCMSCERKIAEKPNDPCQVEYIQHKQKVDKYFALKSKIITKCKSDPSCLVVEFDYAQNFTVPKLNVCAQFHMLLLLLYVFNIHLHNDESLFLYSFMETQANKDPNSVASFVHNCLLKRLHDQSQQIFPVRGHSFSQCDRNFGLIKSKSGDCNNSETLPRKNGHVQENPSPFEVVMDSTMIRDWKEVLTSFFLKYPVTKGNISVLDITPRNVPNSPLNPQKENYVRALFKYMDTGSCCWLDNIEESKVGLGENVNQDDSQSECESIQVVH